MADFITTYLKFIKPAEGYYANLKGDSGGVTYAGISKVYNPDWIGWSLVNDYVNKKGGLSNMKNNEQIPLVDPYVVNYYKALWDKNNMPLIKNQDVANIIFDWIVNSGSVTAVKHIQKILKLNQDGVMSLKTTDAINSKNAADLNDTIKTERISYYKSLADANPNDKAFLAGWLNRLNKFPTLSGLGMGLSIFVILIMLYLILKK